MVQYGAERIRAYMDKTHNPHSDMTDDELITFIDKSVFGATVQIGIAVEDLANSVTDESSRWFNKNKPRLCDPIARWLLRWPNSAFESIKRSVLLHRPVPLWDRVRIRLAHFLTGG